MPAAAPVGAVGTLVSDIIGAGGASDMDASALARGIALTGADTGKGVWLYSIDGGSNWSAVPSVTDTQALLLDPAARLYFQPSANNT